jgi:hypothetical protein|tara:strand:- start:76 stop:291 length:216 start_codon:yes stop_codon:yes gene_type:complete
MTKDKWVNKDGYASGGVNVSDSPSKVGTDPRSEVMTNQFRVFNKIDKGTVVNVKGTKRMRPDKKPVKATWF